MNNGPKTASQYAAQGLDIPLPVPQTEIKTTVEKLLATLKQIRRAQVSTQQLLKIVRNDCQHPETIRVSHTGHLFERCTTCGKEW